MQYQLWLFTVIVKTYAVKLDHLGLNPASATFFSCMTLNSELTSQKKMMKIWLL